MVAQSPPTTKLFVLDTNVILHDSGCIRNFAEHDIAIPITVLEELDQFKRGNEDINFQAREFLRRLDDLTGDALSEGGASLGDGLGSIRVVLGGELDGKLKASFFQDTPDHRIFNTALVAAKARACPAGRADQQGHQPADEGQIAGPAGAGLFQRQDRIVRQALHRQAGDHRRGERDDLAVL